MLRKYLETLKRKTQCSCSLMKCLGWTPVILAFSRLSNCLERVGFEAGQSETDSLWFGNHLDDEYFAGQQGRFAQSCDSLHLSPSVQSGRDGGVSYFKRILDGALPDSRVVYGDRWNTFYLNMLNRSLSVAQNIDELFFSSSAPLRSEYGFLFKSLFKESTLYRRVVEALAKKLKGMTRPELIEELKVEDSGYVSTVLSDLCNCDFIRKYSAFGKTDRDFMYQLTDLYSLSI